jgi:Raf kinase inhibitor-like YbhB/YbcL family protein
MKMRFALIALLLWPALGGCSRSSSPPERQSTNPPKGGQSAMQITSSAFKDGQPIPRQYTCDGVNISPPLEWNGTPKSARTIAIIADDPDAPAGTWVHWVVYNLPADNIGLVENLPPTENLQAGGFQGKNDFQKIGYGGPCPPSGTHRYFFKVYALDSELPLKGAATKADLEPAMQGHIVAQAQLMGTYGR